MFGYWYLKALFGGVDESIRIHLAGTTPERFNPAPVPCRPAWSTRHGRHDRPRVPSPRNRAERGRAGGDARFPGGNVSRGRLSPWGPRGYLRVDVRGPRRLRNDH